MGCLAEVVGDDLRPGIPGGQGAGCPDHGDVGAVAVDAGFHAGLCDLPQHPVAGLDLRQQVNGRCDLLRQLGVADAEGLATQLTLLVDGSIAQDLVRDDPAMARAAKEAARVLLANAGVKVANAAPADNKRGG